MSLKLALIATASMLVAAVSASKAPFPVPATYKTGANGREVNLAADGSFSYTSALECLGTPCNGKGWWDYDQKARELTFVTADGLDQTWKVLATTRDMPVSIVTGRLVDGSKSAPVPATDKTWTRVRASSN